MTESTDSSSGNHAPEALPGKRITAIHCLLIPLHGEMLLLPNAAVAEVVAYSEPESIADAPDWLLGKVLWRDHTVPLISFERASGGSAGANREGARIAVLNTLNSNPDVPYVAVVIQGIPHLQVVAPDTITENKDAIAQRPSVLAQVLVEGQEVLVPDLDSLEQRIASLQGN
ncbi:MAG TPA: chemotaxis protein CheW [Chromatiales bacterium]|nr:chemotaxis protein CheW [Chromatiales bacterium]